MDDGEMVLAPPKSRAGKRAVSFPVVIVPQLREHLDTYVGGDADALGSSV